MRWKKNSDAEISESEPKKSGALSVDLTRITAFIRKNKYLFLFLFFLLIAASVMMRNGKAETAVDPEFDFAAYSAELRREAEAALSAMSGVGKCTVVITFSDEGESVYAQDESLSGTAENAGRSSENREYVLVSSRSDGLLLKVYAPSVRGVAVICEGGDNTKVKNDITEVLCRLLGVSPESVAVKKSN